MRNVVTGPLLNPKDKVRFIDSQRPVLMDGDYLVSMTHEVENLGLLAKRSLEFTVTGPRFSLDPSEISSVFPPKQSEGDFGAVLPHVILTRPTLPWERSATFEKHVTPGDPNHDHMESKTTPSWLALLVFEESEIAGKTKIIKASELITDEAGAQANPPPPQAGDTIAQLARASADNSDASVLVLDVDKDLALEILPKVGDLRFLTSVRDVVKTTQGALNETRGVVVANRLPVPGRRNIVHLVSLEHQFRPLTTMQEGDDWWNTHEHWARQNIPGDFLRFVSLAHWEFTCDKSEGNLQNILDSLVLSELSLPMTNLESTQAAVYSGAVPVEYRLSTGVKTAAWYKGPFHPVSRRVSLPLPVRNADALMQIDSATGMADITYATAWEMGRLLALKDPAIGIRLNQWKQQLAHQIQTATHSELALELGHTVPETPPMPEDIKTWFDIALTRLAAVPFDYLVADPALLPRESFSYFLIDNAWIDALLDGAFSIGRASHRQLERDRLSRLELPGINAQTGQYDQGRSGVLLRSRAVLGWPDLVLDGFDERDDPAVSDRTPVAPIRYEFIGRDTLLVLFDGFINRVDIHLHPNAIHFGLDRKGEDGFAKGVHDITYHTGTKKVINITKLAHELIGSAAGSHDFAFEMIEGLPKMTHKFWQAHD